MSVQAELEAIVEAVRAEHAPDRRLAVFEVEVSPSGEGWVVSGATSHPAAAEALETRVGTYAPAGSAGVSVRVDRLPLPDLRPVAHALVTAAIAPIMNGPDVAGVMISQALAGHRLLVLREREGWLQVRGEEGYLGWVNPGYVRRVDEGDAGAWEMGAGGERAFSLGARLQGERGEILARLPWGSHFTLLGDGRARVASGATGVVEGDWVRTADADQRFPPTREAVVDTAQRWMGAPYLWGGTTPAGVDCSGLVQAVYRTHGEILPRDSDQQSKAGEAVDPGGDWSGLAPGDLLFFEERPGRITHVTISMGGSRIIHSSLGNGGMAVNDLAGELPYETDLARMFVGARRIIHPEL